MKMNAINAVLNYLFTNWAHNASDRGQFNSNLSLMDAISREILFLAFYLRFRDISWREYRHLSTDTMEETFKTASLLWQAYSQGYQWLRDYEGDQAQLSWIEPPDDPVLALPEGSETALERQIKEIEEEANADCVWYYDYYELYEPHVLRALRALRAGLNDYELLVFTQLLSDRWDISDDAYAASCEAEAELWAEIRAASDAD
jgi:hypothetical protein